jgi:hypothetical protein
LNYVVGFILLVNGGKEADAFELLCALTGDSKSKLEGGLINFYSNGFPLYHTYRHCFDRILGKNHSNVQKHLEAEGFLHPMWL